MATHFSILAWGIQGTEEPGGGLATVHGVAKESDTTERAYTLSSQGACCNLAGTLMLGNCCLHIVPVRNEQDLNQLDVCLK